MEKVKKILDELNRNGTKWREDIRKRKTLMDIEDMEIRQKVNEIVAELRFLLKGREEKSVLKEFEKEIGDSELAEIFVDHTYRSLRWFYIMEPVRKLEEPAVAMLFENLFRKYVLRYEKTYCSICGQFGLKEEEVTAVAETLDFLVFYYIKNHYGRRTIVSDFEDETGLSDTVCEIFAELIEENYNTLQLNFIMDQMKEMDLK